MTDLPAWLQEIRERADKAEPGPWRVAGRDAIVRREVWTGHYIIAAGDAMTPNNALRPRQNMEFIAHSRTDVPRLIGLVGEMAGVLESFRDTNCQRMGCMQCRDDVCLSKLWGRLDDVLAKYHGEVENA